MRQYECEDKLGEAEELITNMLSMIGYLPVSWDEILGDDLSKRIVGFLKSIDSDSLYADWFEDG